MVQSFSQAFSSSPTYLTYHLKLDERQSVASRDAMDDHSRTHALSEPSTVHSVTEYEGKQSTSYIAAALLFCFSAGKATIGFHPVATAYQLPLLRKLRLDSLLLLEFCRNNSFAPSQCASLESCTWRERNHDGCLLFKVRDRPQS